MDGKIFIEGLRINCIIGTLPRERRKKQRIIMDLEFPAPVRKPARRDDLRDTINYHRITKRIEAFVSQSRFYLIETLAERLARTLLREFKLKSLLLRVRKPSAIRNANSVGVEIRRK